MSEGPAAGKTHFRGPSLRDPPDAYAGPGSASPCRDPRSPAVAAAGAATSSAIRPRFAARIAPTIAVSAPAPGALGTWNPSQAPRTAVLSAANAATFPNAARCNHTPYTAIATGGAIDATAST